MVHSGGKSAHDPVRPCEFVPGGSAGVLVFAARASVVIAQHRRVAFEALPQDDRAGADVRDVVPECEECAAVAPA